jgi:hypothetical protein
MGYSLWRRARRLETEQEAPAAGLLLGLLRAAAQLGGVSADRTRTSRGADAERVRPA